MADSASVFGIVVGDGAPLNQVTVRVLRGPSRGVATQSGRDGRYRFLGLEPGFYELAFSRVGFDYRMARFELCAGEQAEVDPVLFSHTTLLDLRVFGKTPSLSMATSGSHTFDVSDPNRLPRIVCL